MTIQQTETFLLSTELRRLQYEALQRDRDGLTRGEDASSSGPATTALANHTAGSSPAPGHIAPNHMVTVLPNGAWLISLACPHCRVMLGFSAPVADAQATIADWQSHVAECRGEVA